ncbi:sigma 54-interacting transcriptional regulator, partial [Escherichia coli]|nr:sigma 54-interacting transcriptional regulator [Escherichia coli]
SLLEAELFGYEEGAFTGSRRGGRAGLFEIAHGGTLFLDEIGEMPLPLQTRLLRVLEEKEVTRVGGHQPVPVDVPPTSAPHSNLAADMQPARLRRDLF